MPTWSDIVSIGRSLKIPTISRQQLDRQSTTALTTYEIPRLADRMKIHRAEALLQLPLHNDTVLFELPSMAFDIKEDVFLTLASQIGPTLGARIISGPPNRMNGKFMVEAKFQTQDDTDKALNDGITVDDTKHQAIVTRTENEELPNMVRVHMSGLPFEKADELSTNLKKAMEHYGTVCQIKILRQRNTFIGAATVLLDIDDSKREQKFEPLQRMLYLDVWEKYVPANFKGAPPVCYHCRQSGHLKRDCPIMAQIVCYKCDGRGHIARHCDQATIPTRRNRSIEEEADLPAAEKITKKSKKDEIQKNEEKHEKIEKNTEKEINAKNENNAETGYESQAAGGGRSPKSSISSNSMKSVELNEMSFSNSSQNDDIIDITMPDKNGNEDSITDDLVFGEGNILASKHAPITKAAKMKVDDPKELEDDQNTQEADQETLITDPRRMLEQTKTAPNTKRMNLKKNQEESSYEDKVVGLTIKPKTSKTPSQLPKKSQAKSTITTPSPRQ
jgi:hypothetical protein